MGDQISKGQHGATTATALMHYIFGAAGQYTSNARVLGAGVDRAEFLTAVTNAWEDLDPDTYPFIRAVAKQAREHDDRDQFLAGIDLTLAGITTLHLPSTA